MTSPSRPTPPELPQGLLGALLDRLSVAVIVAGGSPRRIVYANPRALAIVGVDRYELLGSDIDRLRRLLNARPHPVADGEWWKGTVTRRDETRPIKLRVSHGHNLTVMELHDSAEPRHPSTETRSQAPSSAQ